MGVSGSRQSSLSIAKGKGHACGRATWLRRIIPSIQLRDSAGISPASPGPLPKNWQQPAPFLNSASQTANQPAVSHQGGRTVNREPDHTGSYAAC
jgi:hypothetical protein